jgi:two-component system chemotaxis sensor kinase CheA
MRLRPPADYARQIQSAVLQLQEALETAGNGERSEVQSLAQDRELMTDFVLESREHLSAIETQLLELERDPCDAEALNAAFRGFHTIKGLAGFLELAEIQKLAHEVEAVLDRARDAQLRLTSAAIDVILESADYLRRWVAHLEASLENRDTKAPASDETLYMRIQGLLSAQSPTAAVEALAALAAAVEDPEAAAVPAPGENAPRAASATRHETMAVKVDTQKLDYLVDMAGEMVIAETLVRHDPELSATRSPRLQRNLAQLTRITADLHKTVMAMRLVPIGPLFRRMARLVRDLARQFGKNVEMVTEGDEIELDRTIVEELADPLMHMVRNAIDHGIETPEERLKNGKEVPACLSLKAQHRAGQVVIAIADDGRGLNRDKILKTARERGLIASGDAMDDAKVYDLIFEPGFSTAAQVTQVSGRGVGMDVVRRHIEKLRGRIEIRSSPGAGTTFSLKLPLTLAIIDGLVVGVGSERYILPMFVVREMFRPRQETLWTVQQRGEMALVRGALLPVLRLHRSFAVTPRSEDPLHSVVVVVEAEGHRFCLVVDELIGKQEVVIKGLGDLFKQATGIAGGAILGDGRVGLILDVDRLYKGWVGLGPREPRAPASGRANGNR